MTRLNPWRLLRSLEDWTLRIEPLPPGVYGDCHWATKTITLSPRLNQVERRCTILHEVIHAERGPFPAYQRAREEATVAEETARRLIPLHDLGEALAFSRDLAVVADILWVDVPTLHVRLTHTKHPSERNFLHEKAGIWT